MTCAALFVSPRYATFSYPLAVFLIFFDLAHCAKLMPAAFPASLRTWSIVNLLGSFL